MASWADVVVDRSTFPYNFSGVLLPLLGKMKGHRVHHGGDSWRVLCGVHKQSQRRFQVASTGRNHEGIEKPNMEGKFPIFIRALSGKTIFLVTQSINTVKQVKASLQAHVPMHMEEAVLVYEGKVLTDSDPISKFKISRNSTLILTNRLRGGATGKGVPSSSRPSFREVVGKDLGKDANMG